jgi:urea carboxylase
MIVFPIAFDDRWNREALERYMSTTRSKAVYLPSDIDYLAKNNGLQGDATVSLEKVQLYNSVPADEQSWWLVFGVGFYLACPLLVSVSECRGAPGDM